MTGVRIRPGRHTDANAVAAVCRATAAGGSPQPSDVVDPTLVELVYARPYLALEPSTARVMLSADRVVGYVVGARDSTEFYRRWRADWAPAHLPRRPGADPELEQLLRDPMSALPADVERYPSHLHINLLPGARGGGHGLTLLESFCDGLHAAGSTGVHLRVDAANAGAVRFYRRAGFTLLSDGPTPTMVRRLNRTRG